MKVTSPLAGMTCAPPMFGWTSAKSADGAGAGRCANSLGDVADAHHDTVDGLRTSRGARDGEVEVRPGPTWNQAGDGAVLRHRDGSVGADVAGAGPGTCGGPEGHGDPAADENCGSGRGDECKTLPAGGHSEPFFAPQVAWADPVRPSAARRISIGRCETSPNVRRGRSPIRANGAATPCLVNASCELDRPCQSVTMTEPSATADSFALNRANWDERAPAHAASPDYAVERFVTDPTFLSHVVQFDLPLLGDVKGLRGIHLQCHIGTDTISLARLGADMTGLDFSAAAIDEARKLAARTNSPTEFVQSDVYEAASVLTPGSYDLVFTGIGALLWLPDIARWAEVVATLLRPGGRLFIREGHPMLWAVDESVTDAVTLGYSYFEHAEPLVDSDPGTYVQTDVEFESTVTHAWGHGLGEIITALLANGMQLTGFVEHQSVPYEALPGQMVKGELDEWQLADRPERLAHTYTLQAVKSL